MRKVIGYIPGDIGDVGSIGKVNMAEKVAAERGCLLVVLYPGINWYDIEQRWKLDFLVSMGFEDIDALIIDTEFVKNYEAVISFSEEVVALGKSVVFLESSVDGFSGVSFNCENVFSNIFDHLADVHNCKRIALVGDSSETRFFPLAKEIYEAKVFIHGLEKDSALILDDDFSINGKTEKILDFYRKNKPDAIMCVDKVLALQITELMRDNGIKIPEDVCITGMSAPGVEDDIRYKSLSSGVKNIEDLMKEAFNIIEERSENCSEIIHKKVSCKPVYSETCGCVENTDGKIEFKYVRALARELENYSLQETRQYRFTESLMQIEEQEKFEKLIFENIPEYSCFCISNSFMHRLFGESKGTSTGVKKDNYFIVADRLFGSVKNRIVTRKSIIEKYAENENNTQALFIFAATSIKNPFGFVAFAPPLNSARLFTMKSFMKNFCTSISNYISDKILKGANKELEANYSNIRKLQIRDAMTGLYNSKGLLAETEKIKDKCVLNGDNLWFICVDLDHLGNINDIYGHSEGDEAIHTLAQIIGSCAGRDEICARIGADEFVIVIHGDAEGERAVANFMANLEGRIENYNVAAGKDYTLQINSSSYMTAVCEETVIKEALDAAFANKRIIKNNRRNKIGDGGDDYLSVNPSEAKMVRDIIDNNRFRYAFQPIIDAKTGEICAYEALMRSNTDKSISPAVILKYAKMDCRLYDIERLTFFNVLETVTNNVELIAGKKIFINSIPGHQIDEIDFERLKKDYRQHFKSMVVEITEETELDEAGLETMLTRSSEEGFEVAIDDYGCGYSNTASLLKYLPNCVKIDRLLITEIQEDPRKQHFVKNIIEFAHDNGFKVLAEGVETSAELKAVIHMGVDLIQGYYTAKPSFDIIQEIPAEIKNEIIDVNYNPNDKLLKKVFIVNKKEEVSLMGLALDKYTGMLVSDSRVLIKGNPNYVAGMRIKVKENCSSTIILKDVRLESEDDRACIEIGENSRLTIVLEGENELRQGGIYVPNGSSLRIIGAGNLSIVIKKKNCYGIGSDFGHAFGKIEYAGSGNLSITIDGDQCVGIGGGTNLGNGSISLEGGKIKLFCIGTKCLGVGNVKNITPVRIFNCNVDISLDCQMGICIGANHEGIDVKVSKSRLNFGGTGDEICSFGAVGNVKGAVSFTASTLKSDIQARECILVGSKGGSLDITATNSVFEVNGGGDLFTVIGSRDLKSTVKFTRVALNGNVVSPDLMCIATSKEDSVLEKCSGNLITS